MKGEAVPCPECHGSRLNPVARHVRLQGKTIDDFAARSAGEALALVGKLRFRGTQKVIAADLVPEIEQRLCASWKTSASVISRSGVPRKP